MAPIVKIEWSLVSHLRQRGFGPSDVVSAITRVRGTSRMFKGPAIPPLVILRSNYVSTVDVNPLFSFLLGLNAQYCTEFSLDRSAIQRIKQFNDMYLLDKASLLAWSFRTGRGNSKRGSTTCCEGS